VCTLCSPGTYNANVGAATCTSCGVGTDSYEGALICCADGQYNPDFASSCSTCPDGYFSNAGAEQCSICPSGEYSSSGASACSTCGPGLYASEGAATCSICPPGFSSSSGASNCTICPLGSFSASAQSASCQVCPKNTFFGSYCPDGYTYYEGVQRCYMLGEDLVSWSAAEAVCTSVTSGHLAAIENEVVNRLVGSLDFFSKRWIGLNDVSTEGTYVWTSGANLSFVKWSGNQPASGSANQDCGSILYDHWSIESCASSLSYICEADAVFPTTCASCAAGTATPTTGSLVCCEAGYYNSPSSPSMCLPCAVGRYSFAGYAACSLCPVGTYSQQNTASTTCLPCPSNTASYEGAGACTEAGYYVPDGASDITPCPASTYSAGGTSSCTS